MADRKSDRTTPVNEENPATPVLVPSLAVITDQHKDLQHPVVNVSSRNNEYVLVELDKDGLEVIGSDFTVGEVTYRTSFANNPNFKVKKNPR